MKSDQELRQIIENNSVPEPNSGCWLWLGSVMTHGMGYGRLGTGKRGARKLAHRISYRVFNGDLPDHLDVCHKCDMPICVNPGHLFLGTRGENTQDMWSKGRGVAWNSRKTHCKHGHELTGLNAKVTKSGFRICRECMRERSKVFQRGKRAKLGLKGPRTHCFRGHLLDEKNVYFYKTGKRSCRMCMYLRNRGRLPNIRERLNGFK